MISNKPAPQSPVTEPEKLVSCCCHACDGSGFTDEKRDVFCPICQGRGTVRRPIGEVANCNSCQGEAEITVDSIRRATIGIPARKTKSHIPCVHCCATGRVAADPAAPFIDRAKQAAEEIGATPEDRLARLETRVAQLEEKLAVVVQALNL